MPTTAPHAAKVHPVPLGAKEERARAAAAKTADDLRATRAQAEQHATWPAGGTAQVQVNGEDRSVTVGGLPVTVTSALTRNATAADVQVTVLDRATTKAAGVRGVLLSLRPQAAVGNSAKVSIDYAAFASAYGGGWSGRLHIVSMPACALTTPDKVQCRTQESLPTTNDATTQTVSAPLAKPSALTVLAVTAGSGDSSKGGGTYAASKLSESSSWTAGTSSGNYAWSYPITLPTVAVGPSPDLSLSYDSGDIDGLTASTNNQGSQVGEGFSASTDSYVERSYGTCVDDGHADVYDQCWKYDNASLVLNGKATELVKDDTTGVWRLADDDASTVTHSTGAANGDDNGEYWTIITGDGTRYVFGQNKLPGADTQRTNSVWTVPVFGDDSGEPGYSTGTTFAGRSLDQAWRWNLDYVVDTDGNAESYWYTAETNYYKKNGATTANAKYTTGGYLNRILYGQRSDTLFTVTAPAKLSFGYAERCTAADCSSLTEATSQNWPDVPFDQICASGASDIDCDAVSPAFFTRKRLIQVETSVWSGTADTLVDTWALTQRFVDPGDIGDSSDQALVLDTVRHIGRPGTPITLDPVSFMYQMLPNRVDATDDILPLTRPRLNVITTETGAITTVDMSTPECVRGSRMPVAEDNDTMACFPTYWHINGAETAGLDWFHKYRVVGVSTADPTGNNEAVVHSYSYEGPAWHYNDSPLTPEDERTWSVWRGYGTVTETTGATSTNELKTVTRSMQGMDGDKLKAGGTKSVPVAGLTVSGLPVATLTDSNQYAGFTREQVTYNGATATSATVNDPWSSRTAIQHKSYADTEAYFVRTAKVTTGTYLTTKARWRTATVATAFDSYGMAVKEDSAGDTAKTGDETCERTWYARNDGAGINSLTSRVRTVGQPCSIADSSLALPASTVTRGDVLSDTATVYDSATATAWSATQVPTRGLATWKGRASAYPATANSSGDRLPSWQTTSTSTYDALGRVLLVKDNGGNGTAKAYTPAGAGVPTKMVLTNAKGQKVTTFYDGVRGLPVTVYDANIKKTELAYDALGRLTGVWRPGRVKSSGDSANTTYTYHLGRSGQPYVATSTLGLNNDRVTSYQIYDALLRPLQAQTPSPTGGRVLTDTRYDSRGLSYETFAGIFDKDSNPTGTYVRAEYGGAPTQHEITFDGAGRATSDALYVFGVKRGATTTTTYTGDSTATTAVAGGTATRVLTDALGRAVERRDYAGTSPADVDFGGTAPVLGHTTTGYGFTRDGKPATVTGPDGVVWSYGYDLFGRQTTATDPDMGTTTMAYTALDQVDVTTDAAGKKLLFGYDSLGRKTGEWGASRADATKVAAWTFDTLAVGQLDSSVRYDGGLTGKKYVQTITAYDDAYRVTGSRVDLDANDPVVKSGAAAASYSASSYYNPDGSLQYTDEPAVGGLPAEKVIYGYKPTGQVDTVTGATDYLLSTSYSPLSEPMQLSLGVSAGALVKKAYLTNEYEQGTGRLTRSAVTDQTHSYMLQDLHYSHDDAGNVTKIDDPANLGGTAQPDTQCFGYDGYRRLTTALTPATGDCTSTTPGGAAPYSTSYTYSPAGLRQSETQHSTSSDTTVLSCYGNPNQPHTLTATTGGASCTGVTAGYVYDSVGNTTKRPGATASQTLSWNSKRDLAKTTEGTKVTDYVYDAGDNLLIRRVQGDGESIVYLGATELHSKVSGTTTKTWAVRRYTAGAGGQVIAERSTATGTSTLTWLAGDNHGTSSLAIDASTQSFAKRYTTPYGASRGTGLGTWPDDKGFLGMPADPSTGLTHIGAREYDPATGRFLSVDPLLETDKPQTLNGYSYAAGNPASFSDPTGMGLRCGMRDEAACPHSPSGGKGDGADHRPPRKKKGGNGGGGNGSGGNGGGSSPASHHICDGCQTLPSELPKGVTPPDGGPNVSYTTTAPVGGLRDFTDRDTGSDYWYEEDLAGTMTWSYSSAQMESATNSFTHGNDYSSSASTDTEIKIPFVANVKMSVSVGFGGSFEWSNGHTSATTNTVMRGRMVPIEPGKRYGLSPSGLVQAYRTTYYHGDGRVTSQTWATFNVTMWKPVTYSVPPHNTVNLGATMCAVCKSEPTWTP